MSIIKGNVIKEIFETDPKNDKAIAAKGVEALEIASETGILSKIQI